MKENDLCLLGDGKFVNLDEVYANRDKPESEEAEGAIWLLNLIAKECEKLRKLEELMWEEIWKEED